MRSNPIALAMREYAKTVEDVFDTCHCSDCMVHHDPIMCPHKG